MGKHISKLERQRILQQKQDREELLKQKFSQADKLNKSFLVVIDQALNRNLRNENQNNDRFQFFANFLSQHEAVNKKIVMEPWIDNLVFMTKQLERKCPKWFKDMYFIEALTVVARHRSLWIRPLEKWKPKMKSEHQRFKELIAYLFAEYRFPTFLNYIFFNPEDYFFIRDFIFLAQGGSIKAISSAIPLNQKMKVEFTRSLEGFRVFEAFRYAQVLGLGGDEMLAYHLAYSWLGRNEIRDEPLWETFIRILIAGGDFSHKKIGDLIDYVRFELNQNQAYSLKGRTLSSLIRQTDRWHEGLKKSQAVKAQSQWKPAFFQPFEIIEGKGVNEIQYKMVELSSDEELVAEGMKMRNCVASYTRYCVNGESSIVSLRKYQCGFEVERLATVDVEVRNKRIVQAKARFNRPISPKATTLLSEWAEKHGFKVDEYL
ncbi:PcfJ domain-containing protein [Emticicia fontis]